ncbi:MAG: deoxyguanosinetriphosphate triphosphohydrolase [Candidatus Eremiobacteraeota bacterium]|nr:deoxyguanosinetriphosphate triphosphohydrolase [Candidatus Eremiobacteraeota bacterium]
MEAQKSTIRERQEGREREILSPLAALAVNTRGRLKPEAKCHIRTDYQRDRDRILYSKAFRRLKHKTQVFLSPEGDHFRTRLTHTLEVSQISRSIARALRLNEDLTEAIALGHDLGHAPFGHAGEYVLDELIGQYDPEARFRHNEQSLRVVDALEGGSGLNLTYEVRDGILKHTKGRKSMLQTLTGEEEGDDAPLTAEGELVRIADRLAYINHDVDDAIRARIITIDDLPREAVETLGIKISERIGTMIVDVIETSLSKGRIAMSPRIAGVVERLKDYMFQYVYVGSAAKVEEEKAKKLITHMFHHFMDNPCEIHLPGEGVELGTLTIRARCVCDYIAGMTDRFAIKKYEEIFIPKVWALND